MTQEQNICPGVYTIEGREAVPVRQALRRAAAAETHERTGTTDGRCPLCPSLPSAPLSRRSRLLIRPTRVFSRRTPRPDAEPGEQRGEERTPCASRCLSRSESGPRRPPGPRPTAASRGTGPVSGTSRARAVPARPGRPLRGAAAPCGGAGRGSRGQHPAGQGRGASTRSTGPGRPPASRPSANSRAEHDGTPGRGAVAGVTWRHGADPIGAAAGFLAPCRAAALAAPLLVLTALPLPEPLAPRAPPLSGAATAGRGEAR